MKETDPFHVSTQPPLFPQLFIHFISLLTPWRTLKQRNPSPPSSPPFPVPQHRHRLQFLSTAASSSSPCPEPMLLPSVLSAPSVAWPSLVARRPAFPSSVRPPWLLCFVGLKQLDAVSPLAVVSPVAVVSLVTVCASIEGLV
ncbi:uncharacterized protein DS421_20g699460 [Arachis hypogaea]|nr:uncharacterized protein DS421_20g699460 [Arachis hypogaea]